MKSAAAMLALTILAALGALTAAALHAPPSWLAGALAVAFGALALAAAMTASALHQPDDLTEPRHANGPTVPDPIPPESQLSRRAFNRWWGGAVAALCAFGFAPLIALARKPGRADATGWSTGVRAVDESGAFVRGDYLVNGGAATIFPQGNAELPEAAVMLIRGDDGGYRAFSKVCTHAGCPVALYRHASHQLICPCHQSIFDVNDAGKNVSGPAPRPLPELPVMLDAGGYLVARGDFDAPVGPDDWWRTP